MSWEVAAQLVDLPPGKRVLCELAGRRVAVLHLHDEIVAIDNRCPHRGGPVGAGALQGTSLVCPWHGLKFDLASGACAESPGLCLTRLAVKVEAGEVYVDVASDIDPRDDEIYRYLVRYGAAAHVGRFGSIEAIGCQRGQDVVVLSDRGQELGEVLVGQGEFFVSDSRSPTGELLRVASAEDRALADERARETAGVLPLIVAQLAQVAPQVVVLDAEITHDGQTLILYHAAAATAALGPLAAELAGLVGMHRVQFETWLGDQSRKTASAAVRPGDIDELEDDMRGPHERLKYDFRRVWECPVCHHRERTPGSVTSLHCACQAKVEPVKQVPMKLVEDGPRRVDGKTVPVRKSTLP